MSVDGYGAGGGWHEAGEDAECGGFTGSVGSEDAENLALGDVEVDVVDREP